MYAAMCIRYSGQQFGLSHVVCVFDKSTPPEEETEKKRHCKAIKMGEESRTPGIPFLCPSMTEPRVVDSRSPHGHTRGMKVAPEILSLAHDVATRLVVGSRHRAAHLQQMFEEANPGVYAPKQCLGVAWALVGLRPLKSNGDRYWFVPASRPAEPPAAEAQPSTRQPRAKRRATVDISCLDLKPGDSWCATFTPDAITIRKATA